VRESSNDPHYPGYAHRVEINEDIRDLKERIMELDRQIRLGPLFRNLVEDERWKLIVDEMVLMEKTLVDQLLQQDLSLQAVGRLQAGVIAIRSFLRLATSKVRTQQEIDDLQDERGRLTKALSEREDLWHERHEQNGLRRGPTHGP